MLKIEKVMTEDMQLIQQNRDELGWCIKNTFEENLNKTIDWYSKNLNWCESLIKKRRKFLIYFLV